MSKEDRDHLQKKQEDQRKRHLKKYFEDNYFFTVATLTEGMAFGELALLSNKPRMATVTCLENCHFMILTKDAYEYVIGKMERRMLADKVDFLSTLPAF